LKTEGGTIEEIAEGIHPQAAREPALSSSKR
jgi:hypothetical protein